jgi:hypothetical protein
MLICWSEPSKVFTLLPLNISALFASRALAVKVRDVLKGRKGISTAQVPLNCCSMGKLT